MDNTKSISIDSVVSAIYNGTFSKEDRSRISEALSVMRSDDIADAKATFRIGDKVKFTVRKRGWGPRVVTGTVVKKNVKTIHVRPTDGGREWRVTASLLEKA
jgi:hypothetical protein